MSRNHIVNNLVEAYLIENPGKKRPAEELAEMDARNNITEDMVKPKNVRGMFEEDTDSEEVMGDSEEDTSENEDDDAAYNIEIGPPFTSSTFGSSFGFRNMFRPPTSAICRWCPGFRGTTVVSTSCNRDTSTGVSTRASSQANSSDVASEAQAHPVCPERMLHLVCMCCMKPMPKQEDLPQPHAGFTFAKSQKCGICATFFCHLLWKCDKTGCLGCLNEFQDLDFNDNTLMDKLMLNNKYESQVLKNYLNEKGWSPKELLSKCLEKLDKKEYSTLDCVTKPDLNSKYILCHRCGLNNFKDLAYQFRRDIPREELPATVTSRPDCHWGRNCRTQINPSNPHHASRYNHICEQTRFR